MHRMIGDDLLSANGRPTMRHRRPIMPLRARACRMTDFVPGGSALWLPARTAAAAALSCLPLASGDSVHHPYAAVLAQRAGRRPTDSLEDRPHRNACGV